MTTSSFWVQSHHSCQQTRSKFVSCCGVQSLFVRSRRKWHSHSHMKLKDCRFTQWPRKIRWKKCIMSSTRRPKRYGDRITSKGIRWQSFGWKRFNCRLLTHWKKPPIVVTRKGSGHSFLSEPALKRELIQRILDEKMSQSWKNVTDSISVSHFIQIVCSLLEFETGILTNVFYSVNHWNVQNSVYHFRRLFGRLPHSHSGRERYVRIFLRYHNLGYGTTYIDVKLCRPWDKN